MFEFNQLRCFVAVAEELHFHRAAARLNMTQPPLSRQIQALEHRLGAVLLWRDSRGVRLTPAGQAFLEDARRLLRLAEGAALQVRRVARGQSGEVRIGFTAASSYGVLPRLVGLLRTRLPEITLTLREAVSQEQVQALQAGRLDLGLLRPVGRPAGLLSTRVQREALLVALPRAHPLASRPAIALSALEDEPLITYPPVEGRYLHDLVTGLFRLSGIVPERVQHISQTHSILALVGAGLGVALVPRAAERLQPAEVALRPLDMPAPPAAELVLAWRSEMENPACATVLAMLRAEWASLGTGLEGLGPPPQG
ncbi:LysR family transcriptional regulator [Teichococcus aestuarii]|uniref:LysR family transcriptional regulator n=1 Tax=Teichococcus aestuarii TaxID=568898 RepID=UPI00360909D7